MRTKIKLTVSAMLLGVAVVSGSAFAQNPGARMPIRPTCADYSNSHAAAGYRSQALQHLQSKLPLVDGFGSVGRIRGAVVSPRGRPFETDPDPNIRFEMNRDDFDRRHGV